jgi:hypothetical protein
MVSIHEHPRVLGRRSRFITVSSQTPLILINLMIENPEQEEKEVSLSTIFAQQLDLGEELASDSKEEEFPKLLDLEDPAKKVSFEASEFPVLGENNHNTAFESSTNEKKAFASKKFVPQSKFMAA